jgi:hypothetical protein
VAFRKQITGHCGITQMEAATARAAKSADDAHAAADFAAAQLAEAVTACTKLQYHLDRQIADTARVQDAAAQQAAHAAAEAADRVDQALADQLLLLQGNFDAQLLQQEAAAAGTLQKALDDAHEHRRMLLEQAASERCGLLCKSSSTPSVRRHAILSQLPCHPMISSPTMQITAVQGR